MIAAVGVPTAIVTAAAVDVSAVVSCSVRFVLTGLHFVMIRLRFRHFRFCCCFVDVLVAVVALCAAVVAVVAAVGAAPSLHLRFCNFGF